MPKICDMTGVREYAEEFPVELWMDEEVGRLVIVALNQAGYDGVAIDFADLVAWMRSGAPSIGGKVLFDSIRESAEDGDNS